MAKVIRPDVAIILGILLIIIAISQLSSNPFLAIMLGLIGLWMIFG
jgi:hypothetical protein